MTVTEIRVDRRLRRDKRIGVRAYVSHCQYKGSHNKIKSKMAEVPPTHILHCGYSHSTLREWQTSDTTVKPSNLMYPLFIV